MKLHFIRYVWKCCSWVLSYLFDEHGLSQSVPYQDLLDLLTILLRFSFVGSFLSVSFHSDSSMCIYTVFILLWGCKVFRICELFLFTDGFIFYWCLLSMDALWRHQSGFACYYLLLSLWSFPLLCSFVMCGFYSHMFFTQLCDSFLILYSALYMCCLSEIA